MLFARKSAFVVDRSAPVIFTNPVLESQILSYDSDMGVFTNNYISAFLNISNTGSGAPIGSIDTDTISMKTLVGGSNITVVDNGTYISINNDSTVVVNTISDMNALSLTSDNGRTALVLNTGGGNPGLYVFNGSWIAIAGGDAGTGLVNLVHDQFAYNTASPFGVISLPAGAVVINTQIAITTVFNGSPNSTISVGSSGNNSLLMTTGEVNTTSQASYINDAMVAMPGSGTTQLNVYITPHGATQGVATVFILYSLT